MNFIIRILYHRLDRLHRLLGRALDLLFHTFSCGWCLLAQFLGLSLLAGFGLVLALISIDLVFAIFLDEVCKIFDGAGSRVENGLGFAASREELDGGEALDLIRYVVGGGIDFGNRHLLVKFSVAGVE